MLDGFKPELSRWRASHSFLWLSQPHHKNWSLPNAKTCSIFGRPDIDNCPEPYLALSGLAKVVLSGPTWHESGAKNAALVNWLLGPPLDGFADPSRQTEWRVSKHGNLASAKPPFHSVCEVNSSSALIIHSFCWKRRKKLQSGAK